MTLGEKGTNFPRREEATNKELILTIIEIQGYLARYGRTHTNWHETLNEAQARLGSGTRIIFPRRKDATNKELILTIIDIRDHIERYDKYHIDWHNWYKTLNEVIERLEGMEVKREGMTDQTMTSAIEAQDAVEHCNSEYDED